MEKFIKVYDSIFPSYLVNGIEDLIFNTNNIKWNFDNNITGTGNKVEGFSSNIFWDNNLNITNIKYFSYFFQILYYFTFSQNINLERIINARLFLLPSSSKPLTLFESIHTDQDNPHWVCIYYINDSDGDTVFFNEQKEEIKRVSPKKGRIIFFDGQILHTGSTPSKTRVLINFNFIGKKL